MSYGRSRDAIRILVGLTLIVGRTEDEARENYGTFCSFATLGQSNVERYQGDDAPTVREILDEMKIRGLRGLILVGTPEPGRPTCRTTGSPPPTRSADPDLPTRSAPPAGR